MGKTRARERERERERNGETRSHARPENSTLESYGQIKSGINAVTCLADAHTRTSAACSRIWNTISQYTYIHTRTHTHTHIYIYIYIHTYMQSHTARLLLRCSVTIHYPRVLYGLTGLRFATGGPHDPAPDGIDKFLRGLPRTGPMYETQEKPRGNNGQGRYITYSARYLAGCVRIPIKYSRTP